MSEGLIEPNEPVDDDVILSEGDPIYIPDPEPVVEPEPVALTVLELEHRDPVAYATEAFANHEFIDGMPVVPEED